MASFLVNGPGETGREPAFVGVPGTDRVGVPGTERVGGGVPAVPRNVATVVVNLPLC